MQYNIAQLLKEPMGATRSFRVEEGPAIDLPAVVSLSGDVRVLRTHQGVLVNASLEINTALTCSRCVDDFRRASTLHIEEEFIPIIDLHTGRRADPSEEEEEELRIDEEHLLDLTEVTRQYAISDQPMKPLCRADCLGLCLECGANLNQSACGCDSPPIDPRWGALAGLIDARQE